MKKYDVLLLCQYFYPEYHSTAVLPYELAEDLSVKGLRVGAISGYPKEYTKVESVAKKETVKGIDITRLKYLQLSRRSKVGRLINFFSFMSSVFFHWPLLTNTKCIIVYSNPPVLPLITALNKKLFKVKYIFVSFDIYPDVAVVTGQIKENSFLYKVMKRVNKVVDKTADRIVALSCDMKRYILNSRQEVQEEKVIVIPNWYDDSDIDFSQKIKSENLINLRTRYKLIVLYSGNMGICQDMDTIFNVAKKMKDREDICFVFTGHGLHKERMEAEVREDEMSHVKFFGFLLGDEYIEMLKIADCHVVSLEKGVEGISVPSKTYSYMSVGRPLIGIMDEETDIAKDIINHELGVVISQKDERRLEEYISFLYLNPEMIEEKRLKIRDVFLEKYTRKTCTSNYYEMIKEVIGCD